MWSFHSYTMNLAMLMSVANDVIEGYTEYQYILRSVWLTSPMMLLSSELLKFVVGACAATKAANKKEINGIRDNMVII